MTTFRDIFKNSFLNSFSTADISVPDVAVSFLIAALLGAYLFFLYQYVTRKTFYDKYFNMSIPVLAIIVCAVVLTIQFNIVVSLGMVGALSIVRFRTAVKSPMDLVFLFWASAIGILCGASIHVVAFIMSAVITVGLLIMELLPVAKAPVLLIVNAGDKGCLEEIEQIVRKYTKHFHIKSQTIDADRLSLIIEVDTKGTSALLAEVARIPSVSRCSIVSHDGEVTF